MEQHDKSETSLDGVGIKTVRHGSIPCAGIPQRHAMNDFKTLEGTEIRKANFRAVTDIHVKKSGLKLDFAEELGQKEDSLGRQEIVEDLRSRFL